VLIGFSWLRERTCDGILWTWHPNPIKAGNLLTNWATISFSRRTLLDGDAKLPWCWITSYRTTTNSSKVI
jgi:hypothetical protein